MQRRQVPGGEGGLGLAPLVQGHVQLPLKPPLGVERGLPVPPQHQGDDV
jgi:hypothetical protein